jgi:hypothetical protein
VGAVENVIHDSDARRIEMLMVAVGRNCDGGFRTRSTFPSGPPRSWRGVWQNTIGPLHDPQAFRHRHAGYAVATSFIINPSNTSPTNTLPQRQVVNR